MDRVNNLVAATLLHLIFTLNRTGGTHHSLIGADGDGVDVSQDAIVTDLILLMDLLDRQYTPHCLRVLMALPDILGSANKSITPEAREISNSFLSTYTDQLEKGKIDDSKPSIHLVTSLETFKDVQNVILHINKRPGSISPVACVTYMMPRPPDTQILSLMTDPASSKRINRYFMIYAPNSVEAQAFLLNRQLEKEEDVAVLLQDKAQNKSYWRILIRQLLHPSGSPQVFTVNRWSRDTGLTSTADIFPEQMANFYGQKLTGVTLEYIPFSDIQRGVDTLMIKYKPCVDYFLVETIAKQLNFTYEMKMPVDGTWGYLKDDGHFAGIVGDVEMGIADFAFVLGVNLERSAFVDFTDYYVFDALSFLTPKSSPYPLWRKILTPFKIEVWLCVLVSVVGGSLLYHIIYHAQATLTSSHLLSSHAFMDVLASFLSQSLHSYFWLSAGRVFLGFWFLYAFLVTSYYKTSLTSTLTVPFVPPPMDTIQELFQSNLPIGMTQAKDSTYQLFSTTDIPLYQKMFQKMRFHTISEIITWVDEGHYSYLSYKYNLQLLAAIHNNNPKRKTDIHLATEEFSHSGYACGVPQGSPYLRNFNKVMQRCLRGGIITKWIKDAIPYFLKGSKEEQELTKEEILEQERIRAQRNTRVIVFTLDHLQGPFLILVFGCGGGVVLLLLEMIIAAKR